MLERCESGGAWQRSKPAYVGCEVHPDFIKFQEFAQWCNAQIGFGKEGFEFDKDILIPGNKVYGPDTCCFVPKIINQLMIKNDRNRGAYPIGVTYYKARGVYEVKMSSGGKNIHVGRFKTIDEAVAAYKVAKKAEIDKYVTIWKDSIDPRVVAALVGYIP